MRLRLRAHPASVRQARHCVAEHVRSHGASSDTTDVVELLTSELVSNAVKYGPTDGTITVEATCLDGRLALVVSDESHVRPTVRRSAQGAREIGGRGIALVQALATDWGVDLHEGDGKSVWVALAP